MTKSSLTEQIESMESHLVHLEKIYKIFQKMIKLEFGKDTRQLHRIIDNSNEKLNDFSRKICTYYNLNSQKDYENFINVFCSENSKSYYNKKLTETNTFNMD